MKYIYDIVLNFNDEFYQFFEWNDTDDISYIKKIPLLKVNENVINDFKYNEIRLNIDTLKKLKNNTEEYTEFGINVLSNILLLVSENSCIAIEFNLEGISIYKSDLLIEEALDIINCSKNIKVNDLDYKIVNVLKKDITTRSENKILKIIKNELKIIKNENNIEKLRYLYYELYNDIGDDNNLYKMIYNYCLKKPKDAYDILLLCNTKK